MKFYLVFTLFLTFSVSASVYSQNGKVSFTLETEDLSSALIRIKDMTGVQIIYNENQLGQLTCRKLTLKQVTVAEAIDQMLKGTGFYCEQINDVFVIKPVPATTAQQQAANLITIKGKVTDEKGNPLPGVTIQIGGTSLGTATDSKGHFVMQLSVAKGRLEFSSVGYQRAIVDFTEKSVKEPLIVIMKEDVAALDEVVVRAYSTQNKKEVVSAIATITAEEMKELPAASVISMLQGRLPGLNIVNQSGAPGSASDVAVRGYNSLVSITGNAAGATDNQPLYVVDGMPMQSFVSPVTGTNTLADLDPSMIESVSVLKDAAAASIYGSRAANGVIIITTKKGKAGYSKFSVNASYSVSKMLEYPEQTGGLMERWIKREWLKNDKRADWNWRLNADMYPTSYDQAWEMGGYAIYDAWWGNGTKKYAEENRNPLYQDSLNPFYNNQTNWYKYAFRTANVKNVNLQVSGGTEKMQYMVGAGYYKETGIMLNSSYARANILVNLTAQPRPYLRVDTRLYGAYTDRSFNSGSMIDNRYEGMTIDPTIQSTLYSGAGVVEDEWLKVKNGERSRADDYRAQGSLLVEYTLMKGLSLSASAMVDYTQGNLNKFTPSTLDSRYNESTSAGGILRNISLLTEELLRYNKSINETHNFDFLLGLNISKEQVFSMEGSGRRGGSDYVYYYPKPIGKGIDNYGTGGDDDWQSLTSYQSDFREKTMVSYFGRFGYNYKRRYLFEFTYRQDGSSTFGEDHRWARFPSYALGWAFSEEPFIKSWTEYWLTWGKFRASYGTSGQVFSSEYLAHGLVNIDREFNGQTGATPGVAIAPDLTWEKTKQYDLGLDLDMFNNRVGFKFDYYYKYTKGMLYAVKVPADLYFNSTQMRNALEVSNEGIEFDVQADIFRESAVKWRTKFNITRNWNRFEKSYNGRDLGTLIQGKAMNAFWVYDDDGYYQNEDEVPIFYDVKGNAVYYSIDATKINADLGYSNMVGTPKIRDVNGNGRVGDDLILCGTTLPVANGGWSNEISWKNFDLSILFNIVLNRQMINMNTSSLTNAPTVLFDLRDVTFWQKEGDKADLGRIGTYNGRLRSNIEHVNSMSLKQITLGYNVPKNIAQRLRFSDIRFFLTGENIFYLSNYSGANPEVISVYKGIDTGGAYPLPQKWTIGLTLNF